MNEPSFSTYTYHGAHQNVALRTKNDAGEDVIIFADQLVPGKTYLLPDDHSTVTSWRDINLISKHEGTAL